MSKQRENLKFALTGNPNSGKTSVFNMLTGARQKVGNWGGVTVEIKEGKVMSDDKEIDVIDLPGTYSLTAYTMEETVARDYVVEEKPDVVIDIVDSANLERNLYLAVQLLELNAPLLLALDSPRVLYLHQNFLYNILLLHLLPSELIQQSCMSLQID